MAARIDAQLERLAQLRTNASSPEAAAELARALRGRSNVVAARAASIIESAKLAAMERELVAALDRLLAPGADRGCLAKTAIAKALHALETRAEAAMLVAARHVQIEPAWGGPSDVAVELRCVAAGALVNMRSRETVSVLVHLLADADPVARSAAVRALAVHGGDAAEALVRYKLLVGDGEPNVIADCFPAAITLTRSAGPVEPFLQSRDDALREAAILALGESRLPRAFELLRGRWDSEFDLEMRRLLAMAIGLTRQPAAVSFLTSVVEQGDPKTACVAIEALALYRHDDTVRAKVRQEAEKRGGDVLTAFGGAFASR